MFTPKDVEKLAELSRISVTPEEKTRLSGEIDAILHYVSELTSLSPNGGEPMRRGATLNVLREDTHPHPSGQFTEALLKEAPKREGNFVKVKKVFS